ncbi:ABC transporter permease [Nonomuraea sp. NPDC000554]|uniref:ABC transporter permease n=1 Tax=Nonomuraea sp. NPDC000554 TaxID=3154259 RepID=UPI00332BB11F
MQLDAVTTSAGRGPSQHQVWDRLRAWDSLGLFVVVIVVFGVFAATAPNFLTQDNLLNILQQTAFFGIIAFAMTLVIVAGEIDISVGAQTALTSALLGVLVVQEGWPFWLACIAVLAQAVVIGAVAGWVRSRFGVPSFIVTLALYMSLRGLAMLVTDTFAISIDSSEFFYWGDGRVFGVVPIAAVYLVIAFVAFGVVARYTVFGRSVYAVGGNPKSATLSGIPVTRVRMAVLALTGLTAGITGLLQSAQLSSGTPTIAVGLEFDAIAAAIIGGTALSGGKGTISGTCLGALFVAILANGMVLLGVNPYGQNVVRGGIVVGAVLVNVLRSARSARRA